MFTKPIRLMGEVNTSIDYDIPYTQYGEVRSTPNDTKTFLPCDIINPKFVSITPIDGGSLGALNGAGLFTTVKGFQILSLSTLNAVADLTAWAASSGGGTLYKKNAIVKNGTTAKAYIALQDNAAIDTDASTKLEPGTAEGASYWKEISPRGFIEVLHTAAGAGVSTSINYKIEGYQS